MRALLFALSSLLLASCEDSPRDLITDQCLRVALFQQCIHNLPAGPSTTKYNDWDEVVKACDQVAYYQSKRPRFAITPECRGYAN